MLRAHTHKESKETNFCKKIYLAAKYPNKRKARSVIKKILLSVSIDVPYPKKDYPAISILAAEGNILAVNFLREEFDASLFWMIYGYARGGHVSKVNQALQLAITPIHQEELLKGAVTGYAKGGYSDEADNLLMQCLPKNRVSLLHEMAISYFKSGNMKKAKETIMLLPSREQRRHTARILAYYFAKNGGDIATAQRFICFAPISRAYYGKHTDKWNITALNELLIKGYTQGGHKVQANEISALLDWNPFRPEYDGYVCSDQKDMIYARCQTGDLKEPEISINHRNYLNILEIMGSAYASAGQKTKANGILKLAEAFSERKETEFYTHKVQSEIIKGYCQYGSGHMSVVKKILTSSDMKPLLTDRFIKIDVLTTMMLRFVYDGNWIEANEVLNLATAKEQLELARSFIDFFYNLVFLNKDTALKSLMVFNSSFLKSIAIELKKMEKDKINIDHIIEDAPNLYNLCILENFLPSSISLLTLTYLTDITIEKANMLESKLISYNPYKDTYNNHRILEEFFPPTISGLILTYLTAITMEEASTLKNKIPHYKDRFFKQSNSQYPLSSMLAEKNKTAIQVKRN
jgi:hypothetical protein